MQRVTIRLFVSSIMLETGIFPYVTLVELYIILPMSAK